jgi:hypothetical protein
LLLQAPLDALCLGVYYLDMKLDGNIKIAVLDRGFVYIGRVSVESDFYVITNAKNIRVWGTSKGLGELVSGPTSYTILDAVGTVYVPSHALISLIDVDQSKWTL